MDALEKQFEAWPVKLQINHENNGEDKPKSTGSAAFYRRSESGAD